MKKINQKHELFCYYYAIDPNGASAARNAGYSVRRAKQTAERLLKRDDIRLRVSELRAERIERLGIDADYVLLRLFEIERLNLADIKNDDESIKPVSEWSDAWQRSVESLEVIDYFEGKGGDRTQVGFIKKIKQPSKVKLLELIGKHTKVRAFTEVSEVHSTVTDLTEEELDRRITQLTDA